MGKANGLSQRADWQEGVENDNENRTLIKLEWVKEVEMLVEDRSLRERIKKAQERNEKVVKVVEELKRAGMKSLRDKEWLIEEEVVMKKEYIYIPEGELREEVVCLHHNTPVKRHGRRWKTMELVTRNYWWPEVTKEVGRYIDRYNAY